MNPRLFVPFLLVAGACLCIGCGSSKPVVPPPSGATPQDAVTAHLNSPATSEMEKAEIRKHMAERQGGPSSSGQPDYSSYRNRNAGSGQ